MAWLKETQEFFAGLRDSKELVHLFDLLGGIRVFVKDRDLRFIYVNAAFAKTFGFDDPSHFVGRHAEEFSPRQLSEGYTKDDRYVITEGQELINKIELIRDSNGKVHWFITCKVPLHDQNNEICGLIGFAKPFEGGSSEQFSSDSFSKVIDHISAHFNEKIELDKLAGMMNLSRSAFERRFKKATSLPARKYIQRMRINAACRLLRETELPLLEVALNCGFGDQTYFNRVFREIMDMTPGEYRKSRRDNGRLGGNTKG